MKTGICTTIEKILQLEKNCFDYAELRLTELSAMNDEEFEKTISTFKSKEIPVPAVNCFFPGDIRLCGKECNPDKIKKYADSALKRAADIGAKVCILGSGKARSVEDGDDFDKCLTQFKQVCSNLGDIAHKYGIIINIEPLNKNETNIITTVSEGAEFVRSLNHPSVRLMADIYHMESEGESLEMISENIDIIDHIHIANPDGRVFPLPKANYDYTEADVMKIFNTLEKELKAAKMKYIAMESEDEKFRL